jgi:hypothetical protein
VYLTVFFRQSDAVIIVKIPSIRKLDRRFSFRVQAVLTVKAQVTGTIAHHANLFKGKYKTAMLEKQLLAAMYFLCLLGKIDAE